MATETIVRCVAVVAAVTLVAAPHWRRIAQLARKASHVSPADAWRLAVAFGLLAGVLGWRQFVTHLPAVVSFAIGGTARAVFGVGLVVWSGCAVWRICRKPPSSDTEVLRNEVGRLWVAVCLLLAATGLMAFGRAPWPSIEWKVPVPPVVAPSTPSVTAGVYVYEKDDGPVPAAVSSGIDRLNREKKILASLCEDDTVDGTGEPPEQYRVAIEAARKAPLPAFIVLSGSTVVKVVKAPKAEEDIVGAVP